MRLSVIVALLSVLAGSPALAAGTEAGTGQHTGVIAPGPLAPYCFDAANDRLYIGTGRDITAFSISAGRPVESFMLVPYDQTDFRSAGGRMALDTRRGRLYMLGHVGPNGSEGSHLGILQVWGKQEGSFRVFPIQTSGGDGAGQVLAVSERLGWVYVAGHRDARRRLQAFDGKTGRLVADLPLQPAVVKRERTNITAPPVGSGLQDFVVSDALGRVFLSSRSSGLVYVTDLHAQRLISTIPVRMGASAMVLDERARRLYVADSMGPMSLDEVNHVTVVDAVRLRPIDGFRASNPFEALARRARPRTRSYP